MMVQGVKFQKEETCLWKDGEESCSWRVSRGEGKIGMIQALINRLLKKTVKSKGEVETMRRGKEVGQKVNLEYSIGRKRKKGLNDTCASACSSLMLRQTGSGGKAPTGRVFYVQREVLPSEDWNDPLLRDTGKPAGLKL